MKKGDFVNVNENSKYSGQDMVWTEEVTGKQTFKKGHIFYHFSDSKLTGFCPKTTCFFNTKKTLPGYCYSFTIDKDIKIDTYCNEVRLDLIEGQKLQYLGEVKYKRNYNKMVESFDSCGRFQGYEPETKVIDGRIK